MTELSFPTSWKARPLELEESEPPKCIFCTIANEDPEKQILADYGRVVVFAPLDPVTEGHLLVVPKMHVTDAATHPGLTAEVFGVAARHAAEIRQDLDWSDFNLITNAGRVATQSVFHLHVHIVPRRRNDRLPLPWSKVRIGDILEALNDAPVDHIVTNVAVDELALHLEERLNRRDR